MLINYKFENFGPFQDEVEFSMKPGKVTTRFKDTVNIINENLKISKIAVIVGENAGGKTSFMKSLHYLRYLIAEAKYPRSNPILCNEYKDNIQKFNIEILSDNNIYTYVLELDNKLFLHERLEIRKVNQDVNKNEYIFDVDRVKCTESDSGLSIELGVDISDKLIDKDIRKLISTKLKSGYNSSALFVNYLSNIGVNIVNPFLDYINNKLSISLPDDASYNIYKAMEKNQKDLSIMKENSFLDIFRLVDPSIVELELDDQEPFRETKIIRKNSNDQKFTIKLSSDSSGVKEFFAWSLQIWKVIYENSTIFADEIDKVLNSILATKVINYIKGSEHKGQFVFTTHNVLHLNTNIFMKEQIYFISKDIDTLQSELYSLSDFKEYKYDNPRVYEMYLKGLLGGVPNS